MGLHENWVQAALLLAAVVFLGAVVGSAWERSVLPLLAGTEFGLTSETAAIGFMVAFGFAKVGANFLAGDLAERIGRRRILLAAALLGRAVTFFVRDTGHYVQLEAELSDSAPEPLGGSHARKPLLTANQAGLLTNLKEGVAWGLLPVFFADQGLEAEADRVACCALPGGLGTHAARHGHAVGLDRPSPLDRGRASGSSRGARRVRDLERVRSLGGLCGHAGYRYRGGLPDPDRPSG